MEPEPQEYLDPLAEQVQLVLQDLLGVLAQQGFKARQGLQVHLDSQVLLELQG